MLWCGCTLSALVNVSLLQQLLAKHPAQAAPLSLVYNLLLLAAVPNHHARLNCLHVWQVVAGNRQAL